MNAETFEKMLKQAVSDMRSIREIRIRAGKPVMILLESGENILFRTGPVDRQKVVGSMRRGCWNSEENEAWFSRTRS